MGASIELSGSVGPYLGWGAALGLVLGVGCLQSVPVPQPDAGVCAFGSFGFSPGTRDPENPCRSCQPSISTSAFSPIDEGKSCGDGGAGFCHDGVCSVGCLTAGTFRFPGDPGGGPCQRCDPSRNPNGWSGASGLALPLECSPGQVCSSGSCIDGCFVEGHVVVNGAIDPANSCESCQGSLTTSSWSAVAEGTPCADGGHCAAAACEQGCRIGDALYPAGAPEPDNPCQSCLPALNAMGWSPLTGLPPYACDGGQVCDRGVCVSGCWIGGGSVAAPGSSPSGLPCQICVPQLNVTDFSSLSGDLSGVCGPGWVCDFGECRPGCYIDGGGYQAPGSFQPGNTALCCGPSNSLESWSPTFLPAATFLGSGTTLLAGDIDGDGFTDLVAGDFFNGVEVFFGDGVGGLRQPVPALANPSSGFNSGPTVALGDLDGDGVLELLAGVALDGGNYGLAVFAVLDGGFTLAATYPRTYALSALAVGDFNGDGHLDVAAADLYGVQIFINLGDGGLVPRSILGLPAPFDWGPLVAADFNGDGKVDLALAVALAPGPAFWFGDGDGGFPTSSQLTGEQGQVPAAAALELPGHADLVVGSSNGDLLQIFEVALDESTRSRSYPMAPLYSLALGDLNGDGRPDLIASDGLRGGNLELMINSDAGFLPSVSLLLDPNTYAQQFSVVMGRFEADAGLGLAVLTYSPIADGGLTLYRSGCR